MNRRNKVSNNVQDGLMNEALGLANDSLFSNNFRDIYANFEKEIMQGTFPDVFMPMDSFNMPNILNFDNGSNPSAHVHTVQTKQVEPNKIQRPAKVEEKCGIKNLVNDKTRMSYPFNNIHEKNKPKSNKENEIDKLIEQESLNCKESLIIIDKKTIDNVSKLDCETNKIQRCPTPDFSLDGSAERQKYLSSVVGTKELTPGSRATIVGGQGPQLNDNNEQKIVDKAKTLISKIKEIKDDYDQSTIGSRDAIEPRPDRIVSDNQPINDTKKIEIKICTPEVNDEEIKLSQPLSSDKNKLMEEELQKLIEERKQHGIESEKKLQMLMEERRHDFETLSPSRGSITVNDATHHVLKLEPVNELVQSMGNLSMCKPILKENLSDIDRVQMPKVKKIDIKNDDNYIANTDNKQETNINMQNNNKTTDKVPDNQPPGKTVPDNQPSGKTIPDNQPSGKPEVTSKTDEIKVDESVKNEQQKDITVPPVLPATATSVEIKQETENKQEFEEFKWPELTIDQINISLKVVADLKDGYKLRIVNDKHLAADNSYMVSLSRVVSGQGRDKIISFLNHLCNELIKNMNLIFQKIKDGVDVDNNVAILRDMEYNLIIFLHRYENMRYVYKTDDSAWTRLGITRNNYFRFRDTFFREILLYKRA